MKKTTNLTKADIISSVQHQTTFTHAQAKLSVEAFLDSIKDSLSEGKEVQLRSFGRFYVRHKQARVAGHPRSQKKSVIAARRVAAFKAGSRLKPRPVNHGEQAPEESQDETQGS